MKVDSVIEVVWPAASFPECQVFKRMMSLYAEKKGEVSTERPAQHWDCAVRKRS